MSVVCDICGKTAKKASKLSFHINTMCTGKCQTFNRLKSFLQTARLKEQKFAHHALEKATLQSCLIKKHKLI